MSLNLDTLLSQILKDLRSTLTIKRDYLVMDGISSGNGKFPTSLGNVAILEAKYVYDLVNQFIQNLRLSNIIPDPAPLEAILPFLNPTQRAQLEPIIQFLKNISTAVDNFQQNFDINVF